MTLMVCGCVVAALADMAPDPCTQPGRYYLCREHGQMVVWDGGQWRWSDQPADLDQLPRTADARRPAEQPD
ncbi:hypothetical protein [Streptomyces werraensis]|uniref:hypothetical protein n=1 Tax=Streptomyces werraensis TaxID=68284 RepID=UPI003414AAFA